MNKLDEQTLDDLLENGRLDEARTYIDSYFLAPSTPEERTDAAIDYAHVNMKAMNRINRRHLQSLREIEKLMIAARDAERKTGDDLKAAKLKLELKS